jgi:hypothetical protein
MQECLIELYDITKFKNDLLEFLSPTGVDKDNEVFKEGIELFITKRTLSLTSKNLSHVYNDNFDFINKIKHYVHTGQDNTPLRTTIRNEILDLIGNYFEEI